MTLVGLIPAHNEADCIEDTIKGLVNQVVPPDRIIVIADNCTDNTAEIADRLGTEVFVPIANRHKKAGALNQALEAVMPTLEDDDLIFIQDADTIVAPDFMRAAMTCMAEDKKIIVSGRYACRPEHGLIGMLQRNEFCQPPGTQVRVVQKAGTNQGVATSEERSIESLEVGDRVVSLIPKGTWLRRNGCEISDVSSHHFEGHLTEITTSSGLSSRYTPEHWCVARIGDSLNDKWVTYLMRKGNQYRIGMTKGIVNQSSHPQLGFMNRFHSQRADAIWILDTHDSEREAGLAEQQLMWTSHVPGLLFGPGRDRVTNRWNEDEISSIWTQIGDNTSEATAVLESRGLDINLPLYSVGHNPQPLGMRYRGTNVINAINLCEGMEVLPFGKAQPPGYSKRTVWEPISIKKIPYTGPVYSIEVEKDHTYFADGIATHNCRDGRKINRRGNYTHIVVGTSTLFPVHVLRHISEARLAGDLPGSGYVYISNALTEDFELTIALKTLGYITKSPVECQASTDVMPSVSKLWHQRVRWSRGGIETIRDYGLTSVTRNFVRRQCVIMAGILSFLIYAAALSVTLAEGGKISFSLVWLPITLIFILDRAVVVRKAGPLGTFVSILMVPEILYDVFLQAVYITSVVKTLRKSEAVWKET